jgi:GH35 family endo-1,4-beta-xylanase
MSSYAVGYREVDTRFITTDPMYSGLSPANKLAAQGALYADVLSSCLAAPKCKSFETWGFTDAHTSFNTNGIAPPGAFYYDEMYRPKKTREMVAAVFTNGPPPSQPQPAPLPPLH